MNSLSERLRARTDAPKERPTIAELEAVLNAPNQPPVAIRPDGQVVVGTNLINPDGPEAADLIDELVAVASAFIAKLDECQPHIDNAFTMEFVHGRPYSGPQYGEELDALRAALVRARGS